MSHELSDEVLVDLTISAPPVAVTKDEETADKRLDSAAILRSEDTLGQSLVDSMKNNAAMSTWVDKRLYTAPDKTKLQATYEESYSAVLGGVAMLKSHQSKRKSRFMEKAGQQTAASKVVHDVFDDRTQSVVGFTQTLPTVKIEAEDTRFLRDWSAYYYEQDQTAAQGKYQKLGKIFSEDETEQRKEALDMVDQIMSLDMSQFDYESSEDFLPKCAAHFKTLCAMSNADKIIGILERDGVKDEKIIRTKARVQALKEIRADYETRLEIMQSPLYALFLESDQKEADFQQLRVEHEHNQAVQAYFKALDQRATLKYGKGKSAAELEKECLSKEDMTEMEEQKAFDTQFASFTDRILGQKNGLDPEETLSFKHKVEQFKGALKKKIPDDPTQVKDSCGEVLVQFEMVISGLSEYINKAQKKTDPTKQEQADIAEAQEILEKIYDQQAFFIEASGLIEQGELKGLYGIWENILYTMDKQFILSAPGVEDSMMRKEHSDLLSAQDELTQKGMKEDEDGYDKSPEMRTVRTKIDNLRAEMAKPITRGPLYDHSKVPVVNAYKEVIDSCKAYKDVINGSFFKKRSDEGKHRMELLDKVMDQCRAEMSALKTLSETEILGKEADYQANEAMMRDHYQLVWSDAIYYIRALKISTKDPNVTVTGAGTSVVLRVAHEDQSTTYVKRAERIIQREFHYKEVADLFSASGDEQAKKIADGVIKMLREPGGENDFKEIIAKAMSIKSKTAKLDWPEEMSEEEYKAKLKKVPHDLLKDYLLKKIPECYDTVGAFIKKNLEGFMDFVWFFGKKRLEFLGSTTYVGMKPGEEVSSRNVSTSRLAKRLGVSDVIAESKTVVLMGEKGEAVRANEMEGVETPTMAGLMDYCEHKGLELRISPNAARQLCTLQVFDQLCGQVDRHLENFNAYYEESDQGVVTVTSIKAIDNDMSFGRLTGQHVTGDFAINLLYPPVLKGVVTLPYLDGKFYNELKGLDDAAIAEIALDQADIRTTEEISALADRIKAVRAQLIDLVETQHKIVVLPDAEDWDGVPDAILEKIDNDTLGEGILWQVFG